jgi:hypothetical protein
MSSSTTSTVRPSNKASHSGTLAADSAEAAGSMRSAAGNAPPTRCRNRDTSSSRRSGERWPLMMMLSV